MCVCTISFFTPSHNLFIWQSVCVQLHTQSLFQSKEVRPFTDETRLRFWEYLPWWAVKHFSHYCKHLELGKQTKKQTRNPDSHSVKTNKQNPTGVLVEIWLKYYTVYHFTLEAVSCNLHGYEPFRITQLGDQGLVWTS